MNVKLFNKITNKNEAKTLVKHITCDCKCKFNSTTCNSNQKWNNNKCQYECENYHQCKKIIVGILAHVVVRKVISELKVSLMIEKLSDETTYVVDIVPTHVSM